MASSLFANRIVKQINVPLLLSVALHGAFFSIILPEWNKDGNLSNSGNWQNTPVIELNALEQTRLPRKNPSPTLNWGLMNNGLPEDNNNQTLALNLPNFPLPAPSNSFNSLPIPQMNNGGIVNIPSFSPLPPPPISSYSSSGEFPLPNYSPNSSFSTAELPPPPNIGEGFNQEILTNLPVITDPDFPIRNGQTTTRIHVSPEEEARIRERIFANSPIQLTANPRDVINGRTSQPDIVINNNTEVAVQPLPKNYQSLASKLEKNKENTSDEEARKNYVAWAAEVKNVQSKQVTLQGKYPKDACIRRLEGTATYGVTVNSAGNVVNTKLIKSSGYSIFNNQALAQINSRKFNNTTGQNQPHHVYVNFKYDSKVCPSLSVNNLGNVPTSKSSPNPIVNPSPAPANQSNTTKPNIQPEKLSPIKPTSEVITPNNNKPTISKPTEVVSPVQPAPKPVTNNKPITEAQPSPSPTLPNSGNNKADLLVIPAPANSANPNPVKTPKKEAVNTTPKVIELNETKPNVPAEEIKLVK